MKKSQLKVRLIALLLAVGMIINGFPMHVSATEAENVQSQQTETVSVNEIDTETDVDSVESASVTTGTVSKNGADNLVLDSTVSENTVSENTVSENTVGTFYRELTSDEQAAKDMLSQDLDALDASEAGESYDSDEVICLCDSKEEAERVAQAYGAIVKSYAYGVAELEIQKMPNVAATMSLAADQTNNLPAVYPNYYRQTDTIDTHNESFSDPFTKQDNSLYYDYHEVINSKFVWHEEEVNPELKSRIESIAVVVIDTGINEDHEDLQGIIVDPVNTVADEADEQQPYDDLNGHGTKVAGTIAALANTMGGRGIACGTKVIPVNARDVITGNLKDAAIIRGINYAIERVDSRNVRVINMSLGSESFSSVYLQPVKNANEAGIVVCASAGNSNSQSVHFPSDCDGIISVGAVNDKLKKSMFSNYGSKVDVCAPGGDQGANAKADNYYTKEYFYVPSINGTDQYDHFCGTSTASPVAAAVTALLIAGDENFYNNKTAATVAQVEERLKNTSKKVNTGYALGVGCVDAAAALGIDAVAPLPTADAATGSTITPGTLLSLQTENTDAAIYYTTNGKTPTPDAMNTTNTLVYNDTDKIELSGKGSVTVKALSVLYGKTSKVATFTYKYADSLLDTVQVTVKNGSTGVAIGKTLALQAVVLPAYAKNQKVNWSSSDTSIATVNSNGVVMGLALGSVTITAVAADGSGKQGTIDITVANPVTSLTIMDGYQTVLEEGATYSLSLYNPTDGLGNVDVQPADATGSFVFTTSNKSIASVDETGTVTAVKTGTATVTVTAGDGSGKKDTIQVKVLTPVRTIEITDKAGINKISAKQKLTPIVTFNGGTSKPDNVKLIWSITDGADLATINATTGVVTANKVIEAAGTITIRATSQADAAVYGELTFNVYPLTDEIVTKALAYIGKKDAAYYFSSYVSAVYPSDTVKRYRYTSSNPSVVMINEDTGYHRCLKSGVANLTMLALDGSNEKATVKLTVTALTGVGFINDKRNIVYPGKSLTLKPVSIPSTETLYANAYNREWFVRDGSYYYDSQNDYIKVTNGVVSLKSNAEPFTSMRTDYVRFRYWSTKDAHDYHYDDSSYYFQKFVPVEVYPKGTTNVVLNTSAATMQIGDTEVLEPSSLPSNACQSYYTYQTSNVKVAKVYTNGTVLAVGNGTANITVTAGDGSNKRAVFKVTVTQPVTSVAVSGKNGQTTLGSGKNLQMVAAVNANAKNKKVTWSLDGEDDAMYASINAGSGLLTAKKTTTQEHAVTVKATAADGSGVTGTTDIMLYPAMTALSLSKTSLTLGTVEQGGFHTSEDLTVNAAPAAAYNTDFTVTSSKASVATAVYAGNTLTVTAHAKGTADIRITAKDGSQRSAVCRITVQAPVTSLNIASKTGMYDLAAGKTLQMTSTVNADANNKAVTWYFTDDEASQYAELNTKTGILKAKSVGSIQTVSVFAVASDAGGYTSDYVDVKIYPTAAASVKIKETAAPYNIVSKATVCTGTDIGTLTHTVSLLTEVCASTGAPSDTICQDVKVTSSNSAIATASAYTYDGKNYIDISAGTKTGQATITVIANDGSSKLARMAVKTVNPLRNLNIKSSTGLYTTAYGTSLQMQATTTSDATDKGIVWSLSEGEDDLATITANGLVRIKKLDSGSYDLHVTATARDGSETSVSRVVEIYKPATAIVISGPREVAAGSSIDLTVTSTGTDVYQNYSITYTTGSAKVYLNSSDGQSLKVVGLKKGTTTITAAARDGSGKRVSYQVKVL